jgi:hypothetical protein
MIKKLLLTAGMLVVIATILSGKDKFQGFYPVATIDSSLKKDAWAVCRDFHQEFELFSYGKAIERVHLVITVLDKRGDDFADLVLPYDRSTKITSISGKSYNALGEPDDRLKNSAIQDVNYTSGGAIYDDLRMKIASINSGTYPYTVEYRYEIEHSGLIAYPEWDPLDDYHISVETSSFQFSYSDSLKIRYREFNIPVGCRTEKKDHGFITLNWKLDTLKAMREEPLSPQIYPEAKRVILAPTKFIYEKYSGSINSWKDLGYWANVLNEGRDQLPPQRQIEIRELVKEIKDTTQMVRKLYEYMQNRTHYVGIQLGIGGFQPFPAETVDRLGYGDCKALSNYMKALLNAVGIQSVYTIAGAGPSQGIIMPDFSTINQLNHAILSIPISRDTIWLECTSQTEPFGYMSSFTAGRKALNITPEGGKIVNTPLLTANQNCQSCTADVQVNPDGSIQTTVKTKYSGYQFDNVSRNLTKSKKEQEKALCENLSIPGLVISDFNYEVKKDRIPEAVENITFSTPSFASKTGSRLFIPLNIFNQIKTIPARVENRKMPVYRSYAYFDKDSVTFHLPKGFKIESAPREKVLNSEFGDFSCAVSIKDNVVTYIRKMKMNRGTWPKEKYVDFVNFYSEVVSADKVRLVMKEEPK